VSPNTERGIPSRQSYLRLMRGTLLFLALLVIARFVLEILGVPGDVTRWVSSTAGTLLAAIYLAAVGPLRGGMDKLQRLLLPALLLSAWTQGWDIVFTVVTAVLRLERSHFAGPAEYGNWANLGQHVLGHLTAIVPVFLVAFVLMAVIHLLWRWPVTVGPGAMLGLLVIMRFWGEAMGLEPWRAAAWSSTLGVLLCGFYLGGVAPRLGLSTPRQLLMPCLVLGWTWRFWVFLATLLSALVPFYKTHFFDPARGDVAMRLARFLAASVVEGFVAGLVVWGIASWIASATRPTVEA
jgi:hypothetical protein